MIFTKPYLDGLIILLIVLLFFGPKRLPALGRSLGSGLREFKDSIRSKSSEERPELEAAAEGPAPQTEAAAGPAPQTAAPEHEPAAHAAASGATGHAGPQTSPEPRP